PGRGAAGANHYGREHLLRPALLPAMLEVPRAVGRVRHVGTVAGVAVQDVPTRAADHLAAEQPAWQRLVEGQGAVNVPARAGRRVLIDLEDYYCAYPELVVGGGAVGMISVNWAEALYERLGPDRLH